MNKNTILTMFKSIRRTIDGQPSTKQSNPEQSPQSNGIVYLMRGLPSCGKSTTGKRLAGKKGLVIETDAFFQKDGGGPENYHFDAGRLDEARSDTHQQLRNAISRGISPIVIGRGNGLNQETKIYIDIAMEYGDQVELKEPESPWWNEIRVLLKYKEGTQLALDAWARELERLSRKTHGVGYNTIRRWMNTWRTDLTIERILRS